MNETTNKKLTKSKKKVVQELVGTRLKKQNTTILCGNCGGLDHTGYHYKNPFFKLFPYVYESYHSMIVKDYIDVPHFPTPSFDSDINNSIVSKCSSQFKSILLILTKNP